MAIGLAECINWMREAAGRNRHFATGQKIQPNLFVSCKTVSGMPSLKSNVLMKDLLTPCTKCSNRGQNALEAGCLKILVPSYGWRFRLLPFSPIFRCLCGVVRQIPENPAAQGTVSSRPWNWTTLSQKRMLRWRISNSRTTGIGQVLRKNFSVPSRLIRTILHHTFTRFHFASLGKRMTLSWKPNALLSLIRSLRG